jgi:hypothetical protein
MSQRFVDVQDDEDKVASSSDRNDLPTTALKSVTMQLLDYFAIFSSLDDPRQVENLNFCPAILEHSRDSCQGRNWIVNFTRIISTYIRMLRPRCVFL